MTHDTSTLGRITRRIAVLAIPLLAAATGTVAAHGGGGYGGGMMGGGGYGGYGGGMMGGGGGWGLFGGGMGLWGLLWIGLLIAVSLYIASSLLDRTSGENDTRPLSVLRERYARGELTDEEFEQRRKQLEQSK